MTQTCACSKASFGRLKPTYDTHAIHFDYKPEQLLHGRKKVHFRNEKLQETKNLMKERLRIKDENEKRENHEKQRQSTFKILKHWRET